MDIFGVCDVGGPQGGPQNLRQLMPPERDALWGDLVPAIPSKQPGKQRLRQPPLKLVLESDDLDQIKSQLRQELREEIYEEIIANLRALGVLAAGQTVRRGWLTVEQAATQLSCKPKRIYYLVDNGSLRGAVKEGRRLLIPQAAIDEHLRPVAA